MKTCVQCKFEIPSDATVCGHCRKRQPRPPLPTVRESLRAQGLSEQQIDARIRRGYCILALVCLLFILLVVKFFSYLSSLDPCGGSAACQHAVYQQEKHDLGVEIHGGVDSNGAYHEPARSDDDDH